MLLGGGLVGSRVAELLEKFVYVKLLEKNEEPPNYVIALGHYISK